jgi:hypothetical protein
MRWLLILVMALAIGCATVSPAAKPAFQDNFVIQLQPGWVAMDSAGLVWNYYSQNMEKIAQCAIVSMNFSAGSIRELWGGTYQELKETHGSLAQCVSWVNHYLYGGYYI